MTGKRLSSIAPSLGHFHLDISKPGGDSHIKTEHLALTPIEETNMGAARASLDSKNTCIPLIKRIGSIISDCSKKDPASTCHGPDICNTRDQRKSSPKRENIDRVSFIISSSAP